MQLPHERGPVSHSVVDALAHGHELRPTALSDAPLVQDEDTQLALWILYALHYRGFDGVPDAREWDLGAIAVRTRIERRLERELREATRPAVEAVARHRDGIGSQVLQLVADDDGPDLATHLQRHATREEALDFLRQRSLQQLRESDPQAFLLPRLTGRAKVALAEVQYDEFGAGRPERLHQRLYADTLVAAGLEPDEGAHVDEVTATSFASANVMSLFSLQRRLRGAAAGHFTAFEASSSVPSRKIAIGLERLGFPPAVAAYFHEHVEADAVHEQVAAHDLCGAMVAEEPHLAADVLLGAATCLHLDALSAAELLERWRPEPVSDLEAAS
jgi:hypothetical protein